MIGNNSVVSEWKENFRLSQTNPSLFLAAFFSCCRGNKQLVNNHFMIPELPLCVNGQESEYHNNNDEEDEDEDEDDYYYN